MRRNPPDLPPTQQDWFPSINLLHTLSNILHCLQTQPPHFAVIWVMRDSKEAVQRRRERYHAAENK